MSLDLTQYRHFLANYPISEAQKDDWIALIASFLEARIDAAFGTHPVQKVIEDKSRKLAVCAPETKPDVAYLMEQKLTRKFGGATRIRDSE